MEGGKNKEKNENGEDGNLILRDTGGNGRIE